MPSCDYHPSLSELESLLKKRGREIAALLSSRGVTRKEAGRLVVNALIALSHRWSHVRDPELWLMTTLDEKTRNRPDAPKKEPQA